MDTQQQKQSADIVTASLPTGQGWLATPLAHRAVWAAWRAVTNLAISRGEGVQIDLDADGATISTVYAPQWEQVMICVAPEGKIGWAGEQSAPDVELDFAAEHPPCPWEVAPRFEGVDE